MREWHFILKLRKLYYWIHPERNPINEWTDQLLLFNNENYSVSKYFTRDTVIMIWWI